MRVVCELLGLPRERHDECHRLSRSLVSSATGPQDVVADQRALYVRALLDHPGQLDLVRPGRASWSAVAEETLRRDSPVGQFPLRSAVADIPVGDTVIPRGDAFLASCAASGRAIRSGTAPTPTASTSPAPPAATSPSGIGRTTAWAPRRPAWRRRSRCPRCSHASRPCGRPSRAESRSRCGRW
ncbi:hypothetical protein PV341_42305 [Streptomyces sp. PA03-1a]|nr:hypothetical protein [Streptomyces sp. PA03-1a]MDX2818744.1 hypothetical protein [Streptomyces sp. PA03-5A]